MPEVQIVHRLPASLLVTR